MERTTVGSFLRANQAWCLQLCEKETLNLGIAYYSDRFAQLPETNQYREVIAEDSTDVSAALDEASRWFSEKNLQCHRWAPATGQASPALEDLLTQKGFTKRTYTVFALARWPKIQRPDDLRILPARAVRDAFRRSIIEASSKDSLVQPQILADAWIERLDEPQLDAFVAMKASTPLGYAGLFQVGDIAQVLLPRVADRTLRPQVEKALLGHLLILAKRLAMANIVTALDENDHEERVHLESCGFVADGTIVEFDRVTPKTTQ